jgi:ABC-type branched-subunit amino acid transport system substrate-binding protein
MQASDQQPENNRSPIIREKISTAIPPEHSTADNYHIDYSAPIQRFVEAKVTHVVMLGFWGDLSAFLKQAKAKNFFPIYIGGDGWGSDSNVKESAAEERVDLTKFTAYRYYYWNKNKRTPLTDKFWGEFERKYRSKPQGLDAIGFDAAWILFTAMSRAADPNSSDSVREELIKLRQLDLITSDQFQFEQKNSPNSNMHLYRLNGSESTFIETLR